MHAKKKVKDLLVLCSKLTVSKWSCLHWKKFNYIVSFGVNFGNTFKVFMVTFFFILKFLKKKKKKVGFPYPFIARGPWLNFVCGYI